MAQRWLRRASPRQHGWSTRLFGRLALLLALAVIGSRVLAATLLYGLALPSWLSVEDGALMQPLALLVELGWLMDLVALVLAAWLGARWTSHPLRKLSGAARAMATHIHCKPLLEEGVQECRDVIRVFNQMHVRIRQQLLQRDQFVAAVAHDLRTPLNRLARRAQTLPEPMRQRFDKDIAEMHEMIRTTLDTLRGLAEPEPMVLLDLGALVRGLVDDARGSGQDVLLQGDVPSVPVLAQALAVRRCLSNLIGNALRYGQYARITLLDMGEMLHISVHDNGPGIPEAEFDKVLTPFYRLAHTPQPCHSGGVGLGLASASEIARRHGGCVTLANHPHGGLVATLRLPHPARHTGAQP